MISRGHLGNRATVDPPPWVGRRSAIPTRVANDLFEAAVREGALEQRSAKRQINYWARIGQKVTKRDTVDEAAERISLGATASAAGLVTVALDEQGRLCEYHPDGSTTLLA